MNRLLNSLNLAVFFLSVFALLAAVNYMAQRPEARSRIDATKTRAYSLSEQTRLMLSDLQGQWTIALLMIESETDRSVRRQIDEVLSRFTHASPHISIARIDPTNPRSFGNYEALLTDLRMRYADTVAEYDEHLDTGTASYQDVVLFAQQQAGMLEQYVQIIAAEQSEEPSAGLQQVVARARTLSLLAEQGEQVLSEVDRLRRVSDTQPIPDYDAARSVLAQALAAAANELYETAEMKRQWIERNDLAVELRAFASSSHGDYEQLARDVAVVVDPLRHLPPLELSTIGRQLATGEAAVILGPDRAAVVPSNQLFPRHRVSEGVVTFDQRFRGEQLIAAAMRSLLVEQMPMVVFMHAEEGRWLRQRDRQIDLFGVSTMLNASRFEVKEWNVATGERPVPQRGQPVVWVPIAPPQRAGLEPSRRELDLIRQVERLIADGESVLLSVYPSMLQRYGQEDPWMKIAEPFGLRVDTARVLFESVRTGSDQTEIQRSQSLQRFNSRHPVARAVHGQQTHFSLPMTINVTPEVAGGVRHQVIAAVEPNSNRWLESNWAADPSTLAEPIDEQRFHEPRPIVMAAVRPHPIQRGEQRVMVVGSGGWMLTYISDAVVGVGGERVALINPGNHELMLASVAWLAGMDDLIAQSPTGQEVARLEQVSDSKGMRWFLTLSMPIACMVLGLLMWAVRRS